MRLSDKPSVSVETVISADPETIYDIVSDLDLMGSFGTEFQGGDWVSGRPGAVGSVFVGRQQMGERSWESTSEVTIADRPRSFAWQVGRSPDVVATWTFALRSVPDGTEVTYGVVVGEAPSGLTDAIANRPEAESAIIERRLHMFQENMIKVLEGVRRRLA